MNIRQLEAFRAVMLAGSTIGASNLLQLSQSVVSRSVLALEASFQMTLFDRTSGRLVPTREAEMIYAEIEKAFNQFEKVEEVAREIRNADRGSINIVSLPMLGLGFIPDVMNDFNINHPNSKVMLKLQLSPKVQEMTASQSIDLGFAEYSFQSPSLDSPGVVSEEFCNVPYLLGVPAGHPLAARESATAADLRGERFIALTSDSTARIQIERIFSTLEISRDYSLETQIMAVAAKLISNGLCIGLVDPFTAWDFRDRGIVALRFEPTIYLRIGLLYPAHRALTRISSEFLQSTKSQRNRIFEAIYPTGYA